MVQLKKCFWKSVTKTNITNWYEKQILFKQYKKNGGTHFIAISKHSESYIKSVQSKYQVTLLHNAIDIKRFQKPTDFQKRIDNGGLSSVEGHYSTYSSSSIENNSCADSGSSQVEKQPSTINLSTEGGIIDRRWTLNLINIGSFVSKKNQTFLLDIILELNKKGVQTSCHFLGDGSNRVSVEKRASELGISEQCQFLGNVENVEEYLWQSDVYVHTATYEPLGLVLLEAMAAGLPVITLDGGGNRDLMLNGKNGYLIEKQDTKEFADRILEVFQNKEISDFNAQFAKQFDIESYCEKLVEIYQS
jgi:glycosyltransferase involved in cell wall biosynthesis